MRTAFDEPENGQPWSLSEFKIVSDERATAGECYNRVLSSRPRDFPFHDFLDCFDVVPYRVARQACLSDFKTHMNVIKDISRRVL
eukprot:COSAG02_NODE_636_length_19238_cov_10.598046_4_plen_85_part_00